MTAATCPRCEEAVTVPTGVLAETRVACPLCQEELTGEDFIDQLPPTLVLLDQPEPVSIGEPAPTEAENDFDPDNPFGEVREANGGAAVVTRLRRSSTGATRSKGGARQIISIVLGGMLALPIAQMILWQLDRDPVNLADSFENVRWMHWAMPKHKKQRWIGSQEKEEEEKDTSTSGLRTRPRRTQQESSGNLPRQDEVVDLNDLERRPSASDRPTSRPGPGDPGVPAPEPVPVPEPVDLPGWINDAPVFGATILQPMLRQTRMENKEWDNQPDDLENAERRRLDEGFYAMLAQMGLGVTFIDETDPEAQAVVDEMAQLLFTFGNNEKKLGLITEHGQFKYNLAREGLRGIALYGTITTIEQKDPYFETTLTVKTEVESTDVIVISRINPSPRLKPGQQVLILGAVILNPVENINQYQGDARQLVIGGYPVVLKQPGGASLEGQDEDPADPGSEDGSLPE